MTPAISTRFVASPKPDISIAESRPPPAGYSLFPSLCGGAPPGPGTPSFLDSNPSDPIPPDLTQPFKRSAALATAPNTRAHLHLLVDDARISTNQKITLPLPAHR